LWVGDFKYTFDSRRSFPSTDKIRVCPSTKYEVERIYDDRFPRPRFSRQSGEPRLKFDAQVIYYGKIVNP